MKTLVLAIPVSLALFFSACGGDAKPTPAATSASTSTSSTAPTATAPATTAATSTRPPSTPVADGTVDPLGFGGTETVTVKAQPGEFSGQALLKDVRMGVHPEEGGWDRLVFEFVGGSLPPATVGYVPGISQCGSGAAVSLKGTAVLSVRFSQAAAHDQAGQLTFAPKQVTGPGGTILEAKASCDFEGVVGWGAGVAGQQRFKVTTLQNPTRLVIDVKQ
ncbi:MAG: hypothetical protein ABIP13_11860 [Tepidiformaceae bacterium]